MFAHGWTCWFGDAESHLNHARSLFDNTNPGWEQFGSPWLPIPHLLMSPLALNGSLWHNGLAGAIPSAICFSIAACLLFSAVREVFGSIWSAWTALLIFLLNPNALYLQSTPMNEAVFAAELCSVLYFSIRFRRTQATGDLLGAALCAFVATLTRYEGWFLLPFCAIYFASMSKRRFQSFMIFCCIAGAGPLLWLYYNWWLTGNLLDFFNGPASAKAIQGSATYPGMNSWGLTWLYYRTCVRLVLGTPLVWILTIGMIASFLRRAVWPVLLLALPPLFFMWSMHSSGGSPIFMPELEPHSWYNTRYGLAALPLAAFCAAALTKSRWCLAIVAVALLPWIIHPSGERVITWKESQVNSESRRAWTSQTANYVREHFDPGDTVATEFDDTIGIFRAADIPLRQTFNPADSLAWDASVQRPDLFLHTAWVICQRRSSSALSRAMPSATRYRLVATIAVPGYDPPIDIYHYANPFHQSTRGAERLSAHLD